MSWKEDVRNNQVQILDLNGLSPEDIDGDGGGDYDLVPPLN
jgi:hypothetical protein